MINNIESHNYECSLHIDRVSLIFELDSSNCKQIRTSIRSVRALLKKKCGKSFYVKNLNSDESINSTSKLEVFVQDPTYELLRDITEAIRANRPCPHYPHIGLLEIALDMKPKDGTDKENALRDAYNFAYHHLVPRIPWNHTAINRAVPRLYNLNGNGKATKHIGSEDRDPRFKVIDNPEATLYIGDRDSDRYYKIYRKRFDGINPAKKTAHRELDLDSQFIRTEVTIKGEAIQQELGFSTLEEMKSSQLNGLSKLIRFGVLPVKVPAPEDSTLLAALKIKQAELNMKRYANRGLWEYPRLNRKPGDRQSVKGGTVAHPIANDITKAKKRLVRKFFKSSLPNDA